FKTAVPIITAVPVGSEGVLVGSVTIGPICPVEPCAQGVGDTYSSREIQLQSGSANGILVPLRPDGTFRALVPVGEYAVSLSNCDFLGCAGSLPVTIVIRGGETSNLRINIDTGVRSVVRPGSAYTRLVDELRATGAVVEAGPASTSSIFDAPIHVTTVNEAERLVFEFPNIDAAQAEADKVSPDGYGIVGEGFITWTDDPHFYSRESLIVLYVGKDNDLQFLLEGVLGVQFAGEHFARRSEPQVSEEADSTARRELSARLGVSPEDLRLVRSMKLEFNSGALGCPDAEAFYTQAIVPGYALLYRLDEFLYPFHVSADGRVFTDCRGENNVAVPFRSVGGGDLVHENDPFRMLGETLAHLGEQVVLQTLADAEEYLSEAGDSVQIFYLDRINWDEELLAGTVITGSGCSADIWVSSIIMRHLDKIVTINVRAVQTGLCEKEWAKPIWLKILEVPKDYSAAFILLYSIE
ncbi:MAG: hypothetical protein V3S68_08365, partial [Dehalococcoidia bacterium]